MPFVALDFPSLRSLPVALFSLLFSFLYFPPFRSFTSYFHLHSLPFPFLSFPPQGHSSVHGFERESHDAADLSAFEFHGQEFVQFASFEFRRLRFRQAYGLGLGSAAIRHQQRRTPNIRTPRLFPGQLRPILAHVSQFRSGQSRIYAEGIGR